MGGYTGGAGTGGVGTGGYPGMGGAGMGGYPGGAEAGGYPGGGYGERPTGPPPNRANNPYGERHKDPDGRATTTMGTVTVTVTL